MQSLVLVLGVWVGTELLSGLDKVRTGVTRLSLLTKGIFSPSADVLGSLKGTGFCHLDTIRAQAPVLIKNGCLQGVASWKRRRKRKGRGSKVNEDGRSDSFTKRLCSSRLR